jgi:hypothetical protein
MQFLSGVGGLGSTPVDLQYVLASLDAQAARQGARLKKNVDAAMARTPLPFDAASAALEQRLFDQMRAALEQMRAREEKAKADAAKADAAKADAAKKNTTVLIGAVAAIGAAFLLLK